VNPAGGPSLWNAAGGAGAAGAGPAGSLCALAMDRQPLRHGRIESGFRAPERCACCAPVFIGEERVQSPQRVHDVYYIGFRLVARIGYGRGRITGPPANRVKIQRLLAESRGLNISFALKVPVQLQRALRVLRQLIQFERAVSRVAVRQHRWSAR
jgi:hypothetical protein